MINDVYTARVRVSIRISDLSRVISRVLAQNSEGALIKHYNGADDGNGSVFQSFSLLSVLEFFEVFVLYFIYYYSGIKNDLPL